MIKFFSIKLIRHYERQKKFIDFWALLLRRIFGKYLYFSVLLDIKYNNDRLEWYSNSLHSQLYSTTNQYVNTHSPCGLTTTNEFNEFDRWSWVTIINQNIIRTQNFMMIHKALKSTLTIMQYVNNIIQIN